MLRAPGTLAQKEPGGKGVSGEGRWQGDNPKDLQPWADTGFVPSASFLLLLLEGGLSEKKKGN